MDVLKYAKAKSYYSKLQKITQTTAEAYQQSFITTLTTSIYWIHSQELFDKEIEDYLKWRKHVVAKSKPR